MKAKKPKETASPAEAKTTEWTKDDLRAAKALASSEEKSLSKYKCPAGGFEAALKERKHTNKNSEIDNFVYSYATVLQAIHTHSLDHLREAAFKLLGIRENKGRNPVSLVCEAMGFCTGSDAAKRGAIAMYAMHCSVPPKELHIFMEANGGVEKCAKKARAYRQALTGTIVATLAVVGTNKKITHLLTSDVAGAAFIVASLAAPNNKADRHMIAELKRRLSVNAAKEVALLA